MTGNFRDTLRTFRAANRAHGFRTILSRSGAATAPLRAKAPPPPPAESIVAELYLYDAIGADFFGDGITAKAVAASVKQAEAAGATAMRLYINSPGGDVFEATAIYNVLDRFAGPKEVFIDGLAASAASYIAMVGTSITTAPNALWMIHNPWGLVVGNAADMRDAADLLDKVGGTLVGTYAKRTGLADAVVQALMAEETWMTAEEALAQGFTDAISAAEPEPDEMDPMEPMEPPEPDEQRKRMARATAVLSKFKKVPEAIRPDARALIASMETRASPQAAPPGARSSTTNPHNVKGRTP